MTPLYHCMGNAVPTSRVLCVVQLLHLSGCIICSTMAASNIRSSTPPGTKTGQKAEWDQTDKSWVNRSSQISAAQAEGGRALQKKSRDNSTCFAPEAWQADSLGWVPGKHSFQSAFQQDGRSGLSCCRSPSRCGCTPCTVNLHSDNAPLHYLGSWCHCYPPSTDMGTEIPAITGLQQVCLGRPRYP